MKPDEFGILLMGVAAVTLAALRLIQACEKAREQKLRRAMLWDDFDLEQELFERKRTAKPKGETE